MTDQEKEDERKNSANWQDPRAYGSLTDMTLVGEHQNKLNIQSSDIESVTDELKNKRTVKLTPANGKVDYSASFGFTDYVVNAPASTLTGVRITAKEALPLTNVLINTTTTLNGENKLKINEGAIIDVRGMNLVLDAQNIEIDGILLANSVQIKSEAGTGKYGRDFSAFYEEYKQKIDIPVLGEVGGGIAAAAVKAADLYNVDKDAKIVIGEHAAVYSSRDVIILAQVDLTGSIPGCARYCCRACHLQRLERGQREAGPCQRGYRGQGVRGREKPG